MNIRQLSINRGRVQQWGHRELSCDLIWGRTPKRKKVIILAKSTNWGLSPRWLALLCSGVDRLKIYDAEKEMPYLPQDASTNDFSFFSPLTNFKYFSDLRWVLLCAAKPTRVDWAIKPLMRCPFRIVKANWLSEDITAIGLKRSARWVMQCIFCQR